MSTPSPGPEPVPAPPDPVPAPPRRPRWHEASWWVGVGGVVAIVSLVVTTAAWLFPQSPGGPTAAPATTASSSSRTTVTPGVAASPSTSGKTPTNAPFTATITVNERACEGATGFHVVPPERVASVRPYGTVARDPAFVGAPDAIYTDVVVTLQGRSGVATVLAGMTVHVASRGTPVGTAYYDGERDCGGIAPAFFGIDLDKPAPRAQAMPGSAGDPARPFPFKISDSDPEVFHVYGVTRACDCRWYVSIDWSGAGTTGSLTVDDNGQPFRTVGTNGLQVMMLTDDLKSWAPAKDRPSSPLDAR